MGKSNKSSKFEAEGFIRGLRNLLDTLPSESQKQEINEVFTELINFLTDLQKICQAMPSTENSVQIRQSLLKLEEFYASVEKVPVIAASVGAGHKPKKGNVGAPSKKKIEIDVKKVLETIAASSADEIRLQLESDTYSKSDLQIIASELGLKFAKSETKTNLADKIIHYIVNQRTRDSLAGRSNRESSVS